MHECTVCVIRLPSRQLALHLSSIFDHIFEYTEKRDEHREHSMRTFNIEREREKGQNVTVVLLSFF